MFVVESLIILAGLAFLGVLALALVPAHDRETVLQERNQPKASAWSPGTHTN